jgi:hypothetical protein
VLPLDSFERRAPRPIHSLLEPRFGGSCSIDGTLQCQIFLAIASLLPHHLLQPEIPVSSCALLSLKLLRVLKFQEERSLPIVTDDEIIPMVVAMDYLNMV